jgi:hypothetical protein
MTTPGISRYLPIIAIVSVGALLRFWGLTFGLPHLEARPDEETLVRLAAHAVYGDPNPRFFVYPSLFVYLLAAAYGLTFLGGQAAGLCDSLAHFLVHDHAWTTHLFLIARTLAALAGSVTVAVVYVLAREIGDRSTALLSSAFLAGAFLHARDSHFGVTDVPVTLFATWAVLRLFRAAQSGDLRAFGWAGCVAGLAISTKYVAAPLVITAAIAAVTMDEGTPGGFKRPLQRVVLFVGMALLTLALTTPFALVEPTMFWRDLVSEMHHAAEGHGPNLGQGWLRHASFTLPMAVGVPMLVAALVGALAFCYASPKRAALVWSFPALVYLAAAPSRTVYARYMLPLVPFLAIAAAMAVMWASSRVAQRWRPIVIFGVATLLLLDPVGRLMTFNRLLARDDTRVLATRWLATRVRPGDTALQTGSRYVRLQVPGIRDLTVEQPEALARAVRGEAHGLPSWIITFQSPLAYYTQIPSGSNQLLAKKYQLAHIVEAGRLRRGGQYDLQDAFFLPMAEFGGTTRPGPDIFIYRLALEAPQPDTGS